MYSYETTPQLEKILRKLFKKDKVRYEATLKKIDEIINSPNLDHYKNLRYNMKDSKRVHIYSHFVLVFSVDKARNRIIFEDLDHHDKIYL
jgi:YafQ family addiction module toxin component